MKLATTTGDLVYYSESPAQAVRTFEGTGFRHLDYTFWRLGWNDCPILKDGWMEPIKAAGKEAEKLGFDFVQAHSPGNNFRDPDDDYDAVVEMNRRSIEACGYLGINKIVVHAGMSAGLKCPEDKDEYFRVNKEFYEKLYPSMEKYNVKVLIENCGGFFSFGNQMAEFIDYCGHPLLGACWDTGHGNLYTDSAYDEIIALGDRLEALHVQDNFSEHDNHLAPYMGTLDIDSLMHGLLESSFADRGCYFTFECDNIISRNSACPRGRNRDKRFEMKANEPTLELKKAAVTFMYEIGKTILTAYDCFEE